MAEPIVNGAPLAKVNLRLTNPNLYRTLMTGAIGCVALGLNFLFAHLTFEQFGIPPPAIGVGFLLIGVPQLVFLNFWRNLNATRIMLMAEITYMLVWGVGTTETVFSGDSSPQLFILYGIVAALLVPSLLEPFFNPVTANGKKDE